MSLHIVPLTLREANALVEQLHRHHKAVRGHKFSIGVYDTQRNCLVGAAIMSRPVARMIDWRTTLEVSRLVTDGTKNACSILYAACARIAREMGYAKIQTYILETETGHSLKVSGWQFDMETTGGKWHHSDSEKQRRQDQPTCKKQRWSKTFISQREV